MHPVILQQLAAKPIKAMVCAGGRRAACTSGASRLAGQDARARGVASAAQATK